MSSAEADSAGRFIIAVGRLYITPVILANIYAPNWDNSSFFTNVFSRLPNMDTHHLILGSDMNCVLQPNLDHSSPKVSSSSKTVSTIQLFLKTYGIFDVLCFHNPTARK